MNFDPGFSFGVRAATLAIDPLPEGLPRWLPKTFLVVATTIAVVLCVPSIIVLDLPLAIWLRRFAETDVIAFFRIVTRAGHSAIWYGLAIFGFVGAIVVARRATTNIARWTWRRRARSFLFMAVSMLVSGTLVNALKLAFGRYRPRFLFDEGLSGFAPFALTLDDCAFPSGHTQSIVAAMVALAILVPRGTPYFAAAALVVSCSRFLTTVHFVGDVVAGAYIGITVAVVMKAYFERTGIALAWSSPAPISALNVARQSTL
jgi:membrane-associated phospholipid phosphatase